MPKPCSRFAPPLAIAALILSAAAFVAADAPAQAQCLSQSECDSLRQQLRDHRADFRNQLQKIRELKQQARALPKGSPERQGLREQIRALRQAARDQREENRPLKERFRQGCRNC